MKTETAKQVARLGAVVVLTALALSLVWHVPYIYTVTGFAALVFAGHLITADDDIPGGFSNPDGSLPFPWMELAVKGGVLLALVALIVFVPSISSIGSKP